MENAELHVRLKHQLDSYQPSPETIALIRNTPALLLVGISGAGKDTIKAELMKTGLYHRVISHTTRAPRENHGILEQDGVEYHFIDLKRAEVMLEAGAYVEAKMYGDNIYGTSVAEIQAAYDEGKTALMDVEVQGVAEYKAIDPNVHAVYILPPDYGTWQARFMKRYGGEANTVERDKRLSAALRELEHALQAPYFSFVVNDDLDEAVAEIDRLVQGGHEGREESEARRIAQHLCDNLRPIYVR